MFGTPGINLMAAGVASAICILILSNILKGKPGSPKDRRPVDENRCSCCLRPFLLGRGVRCNDCGGRSCRKGCSRWDTSDNAWHCLFCHQQRYWLRKNGLEEHGGSIDGADSQRFNTAKSQVYLTGVENAATSSGSCLPGEKEEANTMETIRDLVEKIVEGLIGNVEDIPIDRLYDHPAYDKLLGKYVVPLVHALTRLTTALELSLKNKPGSDSPAMAHTALRDIVERAVDEARKLPNMGGSGETGRPPEGRSIAEHSYEDLLATAILNKVIEKFQKEQVDGNSNVLHGKPVAAADCASNGYEPGLDEGVEEGCSSLEPLSHDDYSSDCSAACLRRAQNQMEPTVSLMIEERIEEVTTTYASDEEPKENEALTIRNAHRVPFPELGMDIIDPSQESSEDSQDEPGTPTTHMGLVSPVESWEENWLFQKKRVQTKADPVAMLVPNPSADFKALIGDKDAEDTSDLSECSSAQSDEEIEKELMEAINNVVPRSPKRTGFQDGDEDGTETYIKETNCTEDFKGDSKRDNTKTVPEEVGRTNRKRTEWNEETKGRNLVKNMEESANNEAKEEKKVNEVETRSMNSVDDKMEVERRTNEEFKDERTMNVTRSMEEVKIDDTTKTKSADPLLASSEEENSCVPKTPTSTPTLTFVPDSNFEDVGEEKIVLREENVLNSLECAKKKLMAVNDDVVEPFKEEETSGQQKADFHAEDIQQESEYTEHYDTATQRHLDSLTKLEGSEQLKSSSEENTESRCRKAAALAKADSASYESLKTKKSEEEVQLAAPPRPGTIAEREHKKWENAPPIRNNPYSEENIQKRLLERQYSRRSSDIPGIHTELPKSNGEDLDVVLTPHEPDIKRFGRDYYINHSRASSNEKGRRSAASTSSRPSSSLSQGSSSTGPDQDQQEETRYRETEALLNRSNDVKSKVAKWQNNIAENKYQTGIRSTDCSNDVERPNSRRTELQRTWEEQRMEEILENERKNNKNEINAKLNNQESYDVAVIETRRTKADENPRKIKRIDLKAYGFENEFFANGDNKSTRTSTPRVVNKLDLKMFGYDGGIRRTQSNIQLNSVDNDDFKPRVTLTRNKSNLTRRRDYANERRDLTRASDDDNLTQSTEDLNRFQGVGYNGFGMKSAKSVPNIAKFYSNTIDNHDDEEAESFSQGSYDLGIVKNGSVKNIANNYDHEKCNIKGSDCSVDESGNDTDNSSEKEQRSKKILNQEETDNKVLPMPSVRRLAQAFSKQSENVPVAVTKANKSSNVYKERSSTPEIQIVESPRQMHSLTARSLSKQFREGLRQIPNKVTSPPASHVTMEQSKMPENQTEVVQAKNDSSNDVNVILPGKLKSNIIFWEQMQRRS